MANYCSQKQVLYFVYESKTDRLVTWGYGSECAKQMGITEQHFREAVSRAFHHARKKYDVLKMDIDGKNIQSSAKECSNVRS